METRAMALDLAGLGRIAGIGGIAVGAAVLVLRPLIEGALPGLEPEAQVQAVLTIAVGAFALGALGIAAWVIGSFAGRGGQEAKGGRDAAAGGRDAIVNATVDRSSAGAGTRSAGDRIERGRQEAKGGRDAAAGGRDAIVNSTVGRSGAEIGGDADAGNGSDEVTRKADLHDAQKSRR